MARPGSLFPAVGSLIGWRRSSSRVEFCLIWPQESNSLIGRRRSLLDLWNHWKSTVPLEINFWFSSEPLGCVHTTSGMRRICDVSSLTAHTAKKMEGRDCGDRLVSSRLFGQFSWGVSSLVLFFLLLSLLLRGLSLDGPVSFSRKTNSRGVHGLARNRKIDVDEKKWMKWKGLRCSPDSSLSQKMEDTFRGVLVAFYSVFR